ncbi:MAG: GHKL domain-containing protein [Longibaculum sp.]
MVCIFEKNFNPKLLFYTTFYFSIYMIVVNSSAYIYFQLGLRVIDVYQPSLIRTVLVVIYISCSCVIFKLFEKFDIIPNKSIIKNNYYIFNFVNIIVLSAYIVFFGFSLIGIDTLLIIFIFVIFSLLWIGILYSLTKMITLFNEKNKLLLLNMANKNTESLLYNFEQDKEELAKIRHDMKNHFLIIRELETLEDIQKYIDEIVGDVFKINSHLYNTGYKVIDTVLSLKETQYPEVKFLLNIDISDLFIAQKDMASILFNLIDNAAQNSSLTDKNIHIEIIQDFNSIVITVTNHVDFKPSFISKKGIEHGYGLKIINSIVEKYNGELCINDENGMVIIQIIIER